MSTALALVHEFAGRPGLTRSAAADLQETTAVLEAMAGSPSAPERVTRAIEEFRELGLAVDVGFALVGASIVHLLRGELAEAERHAREGHRTMIDLGEQSLSGYLAVQVGAALVRQGRFEEAAAFVERVRAADSGDALGRAAWRGVQARIDASRGDFASARRLVDEGLAMLDPRQITRYSLLLMDKAWVLEAAGERAEAREVLTMARELLARKENVALLRQVDDWIRRLN